MLLWCLLGVSGIVPKVSKMLVFPVFRAFVGWFVLVYLGLEGLGVLVFLCLFFFFFCVGFVSVLFALFLVCCGIVFGVGSCLFFLFLFFCFFCFFCFFVF